MTNLEKVIVTATVGVFIAGGVGLVKAIAQVKKDEEVLAGVKTQLGKIKLLVGKAEELKNEEEV